jgi:hypothetical protein
VVAPSALSSCEDPWCGSIAGEGIIPHDELHEPFKLLKDDIVREYADYTNFSSFAIASSIDETVAATARELSFRAGLSMAAL